MVSFVKQAEILAKYLSKGRRIAVEVKLNSVSYVNSKGENIIKIISQYKIDSYLVNLNIHMLTKSAKYIF